MGKNYLPFAKRSLVTITAGGPRVSTLIQELAVPGGDRVILGDLSVCPGVWGVVSGRTVYGWQFDDSWIGMRLGVTGRGYQTAAFLQKAFYIDKGHPETGVWHFPRPYTIFPGERLKAKFINPVGVDHDTGVTMATKPAILFNAKRQLDNKPWLLYDVADNFITSVNRQFMLNDNTLQCPADSPVDIYSVNCPIDGPMFFECAPDLTNTWCRGQMIYGPDNRRWWDSELWTRVINPPTSLIDLNKPEWILAPSETLVCEFEYLRPLEVDFSVSPITLIVTLRGSIEVSR